MHIKSYRDGELLNDYHTSPIKAVHRMFLYELGYGGRINSLSEKSINITTPILSHRDDTIVEMTKEEVENLAPALHYWCSTTPEPGKVFEEGKKFFGERMANPLFLSMSAGMLMGGMFGGGRSRLVTAMSLAFSPYLGEMDALILALWLFDKGSTPDETRFLENAHGEVLRVLPDMGLSDAMECVYCLEYYQKYKKEIASKLDPILA
jgi:hypothetical protein